MPPPPPSPGARYSGGSGSATSRGSRQSILGAALHCFDALGVIATKMEDIRREAGVSVGSLYHHFRSKEAIAAALYIDLMTRYQRDARNKLRNDLPPRAWIHAAIDHHARWSVRNPSGARFFLAYRDPEIQALAQPDAAELTRDLEDHVAGWLDDQVRTKRIRPMRHDVFIAVVIGPIHRFVRRWAFGFSRTPPTKVVDPLTEAAWRAVRVDG